MRLIAVLFFLLLSAGPGQAAMQTIEVAFSFADVSVAGYRLYGNNQLLCEVVVADVVVNGNEKRFECTFDWLQKGYVFQLAAYYDDESESPKSPPYWFCISKRMLLKVGGAMLRIIVDQQ